MLTLYVDENGNPVEHDRQIRHRDLTVQAQVPKGMIDKGAGRPIEGPNGIGLFQTEPEPDPQCDLFDERS